MPKEEKMHCEHYGKKPIWLGVLLFLAGLLWLLKDLNIIHNDYFWQFALMIIGALLVIKELMKGKK